MPPKGTKRGAADEGTARASKVAKTKKEDSKAPQKAPLSGDEFQKKALPLHVSLSHTPPSIKNQDEEPIDIGHIDNLTLLPTSFKTGNCGWKGNKRIIVELQNGDTGPDGKEKVTVQLTINATVLKNAAKKAQPKSGKKKGKEDDKAQEEDEAEEDGEELPVDEENDEDD